MSPRMDRVPCEFLLIRYVPDVVKGEFTNIGVVLREAARPDQLQVRFARSWSRVRTVDRQVDTAMLDALEAEVEAGALARLGQGERPLLEVVRSGFSNCLQVTEPRATLAETMPAELDRLMAMYVEPMKGEATVGPVRGRAALQGALRGAFEQAGVWPLLRKGIRAAEYTGTSDPMRIDCGYSAGMVVRLFQAVSLEDGLETAKVLAWSAEALREGVRRVDGAELLLTAVVPRQAELAKSSEALAQYRFGVATMEEEGIVVRTAADLLGVAETARRELLM